MPPRLGAALVMYMYSRRGHHGGVPDISLQDRPRVGILQVVYEASAEESWVLHFRI